MASKKSMGTGPFSQWNSDFPHRGGAIHRHKHVGISCSIKKQKEGQNMTKQFFHLCWFLKVHPSFSQKSSSMSSAFWCFSMPPQNIEHQYVLYQEKKNKLHMKHLQWTWVGGFKNIYISKFQTPNSKIKTPKSKIQNPKHTHNKTLKNQGAPCGPAHGCISLQNQVPHVSRHSVRGLQRIRTCPCVPFLEAFVVPKHEQKICTRVTWFFKGNWQGDPFPVAIASLLPGLPGPTKTYPNYLLLS